MYEGGFDISIAINAQWPEKAMGSFGIRLGHNSWLNAMEKQDGVVCGDTHQPLQLLSNSHSTPTLPVD